MMPKSHSVFPSAGHFLLAIVTIVVFLTTLATAGALILQGIMECWYHALSETWTIQVLPALGDSPAEIQRQVDGLKRFLESTPEISVARNLNPQQIVQLLEPLLDSAELVSNIASPRLIDVVVSTNGSLDSEIFLSKLNKFLPNVFIDDHKNYLNNIVYIGCSFDLLSIILLFLAWTSILIINYYNINSKVMEHIDIIKILYILGAQDDYIALQFAHESLRQGLHGSLLGLVVALPVLLIITSWLARYLEGDFWLTFTLQPIHIVIKLCILPLSVAWLAKVSARQIVYKKLPSVS